MTHSPLCQLVRLAGLRRSGSVWPLGLRSTLNEEGDPVAEAALLVLNNVS